MAHWDTSALLKLYVAETDSAHFAMLAATSSQMVTAFIGKHEAHAAMRRRETEGELAPGGADACYERLCQDVAAGKIETVAESDELEEAFGDIVNRCLSAVPPVMIRTNDALHLTAAKVVNETEFVSADKNQRTAAAFLGFTVVPAVYPLVA
jgi:predicted nucleic acid-binding protein